MDPLASCAKWVASLDAKTGRRPQGAGCFTCFVAEDHPLIDSLARLYGRPVTREEAQGISTAVCPHCKERP